MPDSGSPKDDPFVKEVQKYKVGDVVEVNFNGEGNWDLAQIHSAYSNNYYSVFFSDCSQEFATFPERMRPTNKTIVVEFPTYSPTFSEPEPKSESENEKGNPKA